MRSNFKVAFTGAGGTGKTTTVDILTGKAGNPLTMGGLSKDIKLVAIPSASRTVYNEKSLTEDLVLAMPLEDRWRLQHDIFSKKIELDENNDNFISDRTLLDHWAYCLMYCHEVMTTKEYQDMENLVRKHMLSAYTHVFYFPWGYWNAPSDGVRQDNPAWQSTIDAIILGYLQKWDKIDYFEAPQLYGKIARAKYVSDILKNYGRY